MRSVNRKAGFFLTQQGLRAYLTDFYKAKFPYKSKAQFKTLKVTYEEKRQTRTTYPRYAVPNKKREPQGLIPFS